ncbi:hypothetical protein KSP39_PZI002875 [Platanthera zijinensis]|uniref:Uncharacterized protein n=1 Tax=Platanthera zijinensis TaxID=2320716 RepID=A0AAP0BZX3_9ASPA
MHSTRDWKPVPLAKMDLSGNILGGGIPMSISELNELQDLNLGFNFLSGSISHFRTMPARLEHLSLNYNNLSGDIPLWLFDLPNLNYLLGRNCLSLNSAAVIHPKFNI